MFKWIKDKLRTLLTGKTEEATVNTPKRTVRAQSVLQDDKERWEEIQRRLEAKREQERVDMLLQRAIDTALKLQEKEKRKRQYKEWVENNSRIFAAKEVCNNVVQFPERIAV